MNNSFCRFFLLFILLVSIVAIYLPGSNGAFYYDDLRPLSALSKVTDFNSALIYIFSETSGPLGRSLSMLTFLFNVNDWPSAASPGNSTVFFTFNIILHAINGLIVFGLSYFIASLYRGKDGDNNQTNYWLALTTSAFWLVLPIHVSTSLIAIQRMAELSAFFVFSGLLLYIYGLHKQNSNPLIKNNDGLGLQLTGLIIFTLLAMLSKENGVLLPIFVLVLETTLLIKVTGINYRRKLRIIACGAGLLLLLAYLSYIAIKTGNIISGRDFTAIERLLTQPQILLDYLTLSFIPNVNAFNPFHDNYKHVEHLFDSPKAVLAITLLIISFFSALLYRRKYPLFSFAVLWFLTAHLLESSVIGLELYFEHRNYVALLGPCLAIVFALLKVFKLYRKPVIFIATAYWLVLIFSLAMTTKLWSSPEQAAQTWFIQQPGSYRAAGNLAEIFYKQGNTLAAWQVFNMQVKNCPDCLISHAHAMFSSCLLADENATKKNFNTMLNQINLSRNFAGVTTALNQTFLIVQNKKCQYLNNAGLKILNNSLLKLPSSQLVNKLSVLQNLYAIALTERNRVEAIRLLQLAWQEKNDMKIAEELVALLLAAKKYEAVQVFVNEQACQSLPFNPILAKAKLQQCKMLAKKVNSAIKAKNITS